MARLRRLALARVLVKFTVLIWPGRANCAEMLRRPSRRSLPLPSALGCRSSPHPLTAANPAREQRRDAVHGCRCLHQAQALATDTMREELELNRRHWDEATALH